MEKDITILLFIKKLESIIDFTLLKVVDYWSSDLCAIGFQKGNRLLYVSTFNFVGDKELKYDYDLELVDESNQTNFKVIKEGRCVTEAELIAKLRTFLDV